MQERLAQDKLSLSCTQIAVVFKKKHLNGKSVYRQLFLHPFSPTFRHHANGVFRAPPQIPRLSNATHGDRLLRGSPGQAPVWHHQGTPFLQVFQSDMGGVLCLSLPDRKP